MKHELEKIFDEELRYMRSQTDDNEKVKNITIQTVKIADISLGFNNSELIHLLRERGGYIVN